jgi:RNA polymerase sigma-70 factor (ECF subfamily)
MSLQPFARDPLGPRLRLIPGAAPADGGHPRSTERDAEHLVEAFAQGRPGAGAALYDRLFPVVDATLFRILGRREQDHADLVQSAFEQIVTTLSKGTFARGCSLVGWAAVIACHVGLNALRSRRRERAVVEPAPADPADVIERAAPVHPQDQIEARESITDLRRHLAVMDRDRVTALLLHAMGYELTEIATLASTTVAAAQSRLSRGRRELRRRIEEEQARPRSPGRTPRGESK